MCSVCSFLCGFRECHLIINWSVFMVCEIMFTMTTLSSTIHPFIYPSIHSYVLYMMDIHIVIATVAMETVINTILYFFKNPLFFYIFIALTMHLLQYSCIHFIVSVNRRKKKRQMLQKTKRRTRESPQKQNLYQNWTNEFR